MNETTRAIMACVLLLGLFSAMIAAQNSEPRPEDATTGILAAFETYDVIAMNAAHDNKALDDFILSLIRNPALPGKVNDIVVECGNRWYQGLLDRYIAGDDISLAEVRQAWRNTTVLMCGLSGFYDELFPLVRKVNQGLTPNQRFRVVAGDPPVDWSRGDPATVRRGANRDASIAAVMMSEVLSRKRKALMLFGTGHLYHNETSMPTAVTTYERTYPGRTFVIEAHVGFAAFIDLPRGRQLEARMASWPTPSLVRIKGTWLADLDLPYFISPMLPRMAGLAIADLIDGYLYLGPADSLTYEKTPDTILDDQGYMAELARRFDVTVDALRRRNEYTPLSTPADRRWVLSLSPGAELVGGYAAMPDGPASVEIDFRKGKLSANMASPLGWTPLTRAGATNRYRVEARPDAVYLEFEVLNGIAVGLTIDEGEGQPRTRLVRRPDG
jgi:hypothetical protein